MAADYKEKIKKLLSLAESPNEHEAKAALLKARQLMAEHKLTEAECVYIEKQEVKDIHTGITCSKRREPWIINLSVIIGENYCCQSYRRQDKGKQTNEVCFIGFEEDVDICVAIFRYAIDCIRAQNKQIKKENDCYYTSYVKRLCDSYGYGFTIGVYEAFKRQEQENESGWGLVLSIPQEVKEATADFRRKDFKSRAQEQIEGDMYYKGLQEGKEFDPQKRISEEETA